MKRFINYFYILLLIPILVTLQGCVSNLPITLPFGSATVEEDFQPLIIEDTVTPTPIEKKEKEVKDTKEEEKKPDEITLSARNASFEIDSGGRTSPFVPYKERNLTYSGMNYGEIPLPPSSGVADENISKLISARVTGIVYEEDSPSAIINVLDGDYLVKPGDKVESFEIEAIEKNYVAIKTGSNVYRAKVGDIVDGELYGTGIYNLGHRFAGSTNPAKTEDILIVETKSKSSTQNKQEPANFQDFALPPIPSLDGILPRINVNKPINSNNSVPLPPSARTSKRDI